jgi:plastocyanin
MHPAVLLAAAFALAAPPLPPHAPADIAALVEAPPKDAATARRLLMENGVPLPRRLEAAALLAAERKASRAAVVLDAVAECAGACGGARGLEDALVALHDDVAADAALLARAATLAADTAAPSAARMAAYRALCALPAEKRPEAARGYAIRTITLKCVPGAMQYDIKEVRARPGEALEIVLDNTDSMQHNWLLVAPGKLAEAGVAGDKMGETPEGKARQFVPDLPSVLEVMGLIDPAATGRLFLFAPVKPGTYPYVCTYPAHWRSMNGKLKVQE